MENTSNKAVLGCNFQIAQVTQVRIKNYIFSAKHEKPISFPMNCERTNLFSVKRDLDP